MSEQFDANEYQKKMCRFGNKGGGYKGSKPKFKHQVSVSLNDDDYQYLLHIKPWGEGSLAEEVRRCIKHCREHHAIRQKEPAQ